MHVKLFVCSLSIRWLFMWIISVCACVESLPTLTQYKKQISLTYFQGCEDANPTWLQCNFNYLWKPEKSCIVIDRLKLGLSGRMSVFLYVLPSLSSLIDINILLYILKYRICHFRLNIQHSWIMWDFYMTPVINKSITNQTIILYFQTFPG